MKKILYLLLLITFCYSCNNEKKHTKKVAKSLKVKHYKQRSGVVDNDPTNDWIFWYLILNNNGGCNYYSSTTPVTDFKSVNWSSSDKLPQELNDKENTEEQPEQEVEVDNLSTEMQTEIDTTPENYGGMTYEELGDYENSTQETDNNSESNNSESTDNSSVDGGSDGGDGGGE